MTSCARRGWLAEVGAKPPGGQPRRAQEVNDHRIVARLRRQVEDAVAFCAALAVELIKVADAAGLAPEIDAFGKATVIAAALDPSQFTAGTCTPGAPYVVTTPVNVLANNGSAKVNLLDPSDPPAAIALVPGRYAVVVTSSARQVWRVPNELQPALLDPAALLATPAATKSLLQTQQVAVNVSP